VISRVGSTIARPPGEHRTLPVAVVLHGRGNDHASAFDRDYLGLGAFPAAAVADGVPPFALASVDGGDSYWHARETGEDAAAGGFALGDHDLGYWRRIAPDQLAFLGRALGGQRSE
jgi:hypothetical protein